MVFPIPSLAATCAAAGLELNLFTGGILFGLGEIIGELPGYAIGYGGRSVIRGRKPYIRVRQWMSHWGMPIILIVNTKPGIRFCWHICGSTKVSYQTFSVDRLGW